MNVFNQLIINKNRLIEKWLRKFLKFLLVDQPNNSKIIYYLTSAKSKFNLPNLLSYLRGLSIIPIWQSLENQDYQLALIIFFIGILFDLLDGPLARTLKCVSEYGKLIDPLMDKMIFFTILIYFYPVINSIIFYSLIISETVLIVHPGLILYIKKKIAGANIFGKYKMNCQSLAIIILLISPHNYLIVNIVNFFLFVAALLSILSFIGHLKKLTA